MGMLMRRHTGGEPTTSEDVTPKRRTRKNKADEPAKSEPKAEDAAKSE